MNDKIRKDHDKNRVAGEDDGRQPCIGHVDADLKQDHAEANIYQSQNGQIHPVPLIQANASLPHIAHSKRQKQQPADKKAKKSQLKRRKRRSCDF